MNCLGDIALCVVVTTILPVIAQAAEPLNITEYIDCDNQRCSITITWEHTPAGSDMPYLIASPVITNDHRLTCTGTDGRPLRYGYQWRINESANWSSQISDELINCVSPPIEHSISGYKIRWRIYEIITSGEGPLVVYHTDWIEIT